MELTRLTADDPALLDECLEFYGEVARIDFPANPPQSRPLLERNLTEPDPEMDMEWHLATVDNQLAGFVQLALPSQANKHMAFVGGMVHPRYRRRGMGTKLLEFVTERSRAESRDTQLITSKTSVPDGPHYAPDGGLFLEANGFDHALGSVERRIDLAAIDLADEQRLLEESVARAAGYEVLKWVGPTPAEHLEGVARLRSRASSDVPHGDLAFEVQTFTAERVRASDEAMARQGRTQVGTAALHVASGELVARSLVGINPGVPEFAMQWITLVEPEHRGHRLGTILKIENHRQLRERLPQTRYIDTVNADENAAMAAVNDRMGFVPLARAIDFQRKI